MSKASLPVFMKLRQLTGTITALTTPFRDGQVSYEDLKKLVAHQIKGGIDGLVPVGTTGESPTLNWDEHMDVIRFVIGEARGRVAVIAGTGSNSTDEAIKLTKLSHEAKADAMLVVAPYYNKPSQEGLFEHFAAIARETSLQLVLYNIPGRCGVDIAADTVVRLAEHCPNIVAIKEASGSVDRVSELALRLPKTFTVLSGDDSLTLPFLAVGAVGVVSVVSNLFPAEVAQMVNLFLEGKVGEARELHQKFFPLFKDAFIEPNPVPAKTALAGGARWRPIAGSRSWR